jgi:hypothetical protein
MPQEPPKRNPAPPIVPLADRLRAAQTRADLPLECEKCGGTFFFLTHVFQYSKPTGYQSVELRQLSITPVPVRQCLCGNLVPPSASSTHGSTSERSAFQASLELAGKRRNSSDPNELVKSLASIAELSELKDQLRHLKDEIGNKLIEIEQQIHIVRSSKTTTTPVPTKKENKKPEGQ